MRTRTNQHLPYSKRFVFSKRYLSLVLDERLKASDSTGKSSTGLKMLGFGHFFFCSLEKTSRKFFGAEVATWNVALWRAIFGKNKELLGPAIVATTIKSYSFFSLFFPSYLTTTIDWRDRRRGRLFFSSAAGRKMDLTDPVQLTRLWIIRPIGTTSQPNTKYITSPLRSTETERKYFLKNCFQLNR